MDKYEILEKLGSGTFGVVWKGFNKQTGETVAIKKLTTNYKSSSNKILIDREVKSLMFNKHKNIVTLKDIINENNTIFLVFEYMQGSLYDYMINRSRKFAPFSEGEIRDICLQIFQGLAHMHGNGYIHRDLKPANLLVSNNVVKIGDFGSTRETSDPLPYTHIVTTSWYRAPEVFLGAKVYDSAVDMWAMGAIMAELFSFQPLFQGSSDLRVMHRICNVLGKPRRIGGVLELARNIDYQFPDFPGLRFSELLPNASPAAINLISSLLSWLPGARPTAKLALQHPFFRGCYRIPRNIISSLEEFDPCVFKLALIREQLKKKSISLQSCSTAMLRADYDTIRVLPENPFEFMM